MTKMGEGMKFFITWFVPMFVLLAVGAVADGLNAPTVALLIWTMALCIISGLLYRAREQSRVVYGALEFVVALIGFFYLLRSLHDNFHGAGEAPIITRMGLMLAAIYVMVRALDNIGVGLKGTKLEGRWKAIFQIEN
jgi:hypothetical protein